MTDAKKPSVWRQISHAFSYFKYLKTMRAKYLVGVAMAGCEYALTFATPYVNEALIAIVSGEREGSVVRMLLFMLVLFLMLVPPVVVGNYLKGAVTAFGTAQLRKELYNHMVRMPQEAMAKYRTGDFITRINDDAANACSLFNSYGLVNLIRFAAVFPVTLVLLLANDPKIGAASVLYGMINLAFSLYLNPRAKALDAEARKEVATSASFLVDVLRAMSVVRVFLVQNRLVQKFYGYCEKIREKQMRYQNVIGITYGTTDFFAQSAQAVGFLLGILLGGESLSQTVFCATLMGMMGDSFYRLSTFLLLLQPKLAAMYRVEGILNEPTECLEPSYNEKDFSAEPAVSFNDVTFSYDGGKCALKHLNLTVKNGEHLAIVGGSGGGKSTVIKLLEQFYRGYSGEITCLGEDLSKMTAAQVRSMLAYVPQECTLFDGSIYENIAMGKPNATDTEVKNAAERAGIHEFILSLPQGYDTQVGEFGGKLSGGQKQRIAIARAVLKDAPIILLDEATSALDSETEREIQHCLDEISIGKTVITIAHRLSTVEHADRILVMESGRIVEEGGFAELLEFDSKFRRLWQKQNRSEY